MGKTGEWTVKPFDAMDVEGKRFRARRCIASPDYVIGGIDFGNRSSLDVRISGD